jgi:hypothetical protein
MVSTCPVGSPHRPAWRPAYRCREGAQGIYLQHQRWQDGLQGDYSSLHLLGCSWSSYTRLRVVIAYSGNTDACFLLRHWGASLEYIGGSILLTDTSACRKHTHHSCNNHEEPADRLWLLCEDVLICWGPCNLWRSRARWQVGCISVGRSWWRHQPNFYYHCCSGRSNHSKWLICPIIEFQTTH